jgi:hypothetical protein
MTVDDTRLPRVAIWTMAFTLVKGAATVSAIGEQTILALLWRDPLLAENPPFSERD